MQGIRKGSKKKEKRLKLNVGKNVFVVCMLGFPLLLFCVFWVVPNAIGTALPFTKFTLPDSGGRTMVFVGFENFAAYFRALFKLGGDVAKTSVLNSFILYAVSLLIQMPLYIIFSYYIFKKFFAYNWLRTIILIPSTVAGFAMVIAFKYFINAQGPIARFVEKLTGKDYVSPLQSSGYGAFFVAVFYTIWTSFATYLIIFPNAMNAISPDVIESSKIDGVSGIFSDLRHIVLPLAWPTISTFLLVGFRAITTNTASLEVFYGSAGQVPARYSTIGIMLSRLIGSSGGEMSLGYPAAAGLIWTLVLGPAAWGVKKLFDKIDPTRDSV